MCVHVCVCGVNKVIECVYDPRLLAEATPAPEAGGRWRGRGLVAAEGGVGRRRRVTGTPGLRSPRWSQQEPTLSSSRCSASETAHRLPVSPRRSKDGRRKNSRKKRRRRKRKRRKPELAYFFLSRTLVTRITEEK